MRDVMCSACEYWAPMDGYDARGQCRRYPPTADAPVPMTKLDFWCGEYLRALPPEASHPPEAPNAAQPSLTTEGTHP